MAVLESRCDVNDPAFRENRRVYDGLIADLQAKYQWALGGGGEKMIARHHARGKILVRERIDLLVDPMTPFLELSPLAAWGLYDNSLPSAGIVTGIGTIRGVTCVIIANDATVKGGSFFKETVRKHIRAQDIAIENRLPVVYLVDCGGANLQNLEDVFPDQEHFGGTFYRQCRMSAEGLPQLAAVFGECTAGGAYIPALADEFVMVAGNASVHLGGPQIVKAAIKEIVDRDRLGGAFMHATVSGVSDHYAADEREAIAKLRDMVGALSFPQRLHGDIRPPRPPLYDPAEIPGIVGADLSRPFDQREIVARIVDGSEFHEFKPLYGDTLLCGFAHIEGLPVGIIANNGVLFSESTLKAVHFIELCDQRHVPLLFLQNTTGFMVGSDAERGGISKHSAKLVYAVSNTRVPRYTLVTGGSYGAGNYGMSGRGFRPRFMFMWPNARLGGMNPDVGSSVLMDLRRASISRNPATEEELAAYEAELRAMFETKSDPYYCTARIWDDGIIDPRDTRTVLALCLAVGAMQPPQPGPRPVYRM
ncbi:3-methylcrotonyl-CoA carboxylase beta subunit [Tepidamorphus gemmatus]|jgi:3-methylcrotonyl-CoA carboxylase beta subunit|uniref:3-methylcrotonyl-CoA carboxylase beta subunit n=1 Tax=Tepidamorphus gemmatus TaxID=747076 RepID=A0A4R3MIH6_9HYPH|nr:carboxyl transferase domain-containing protein [Tepidamorphus gemmatus]TCT13432.1 3-methylcrotonyl-CoA carboxylase beta subunit [Tepidamorphus gemmatus]